MNKMANFSFGQCFLILTRGWQKIMAIPIMNPLLWFKISSGYDVTGWQTQLVTQILTRVKGIFVQIASPKE